MQRVTKHGFLGFLSMVALVLAALMLSPVDAGAQDDAPLPEGGGTTSDAPAPPVATEPPPPPPPPATQPPPPPPPPPTQPPPPPASEPPAATEPPSSPTEPPATEPPVATATAPATQEPAVTEPVTPTESPAEPTETATPVERETAMPDVTPDVVDPVPSEPPPAALGLPSPLPGPIGLVPGGGYNGLAMIWNYGGFGLSQEFGRTAFSVDHPTWYDYGADYGLDGLSHPGLDVSMPRGTWLYSPVSGTVVISGNSSGFTFYGNGNSGVGELRIRTASGDEVILGHMGRIAVYPGDYVTIGQFVGVSGGFNGDHLHLEARQSGRIVDPRNSFITATIESALQQPEVESEEPVADDVMVEEDAAETDPAAGSEGGESVDTEEVLAPANEDAPVDGEAESSAMTASLQGNGQRAGTWVQRVDPATVEEHSSPDEDDVATGLVETARRQPLLTLVSSTGGSAEEPESEPMG